MPLRKGKDCTRILMGFFTYNDTGLHVPLIKIQDVDENGKLISEIEFTADKGSKSIEGCKLIHSMLVDSIRTGSYDQLAKPELYTDDKDVN